MPPVFVPCVKAPPRPYTCLRTKHTSHAPNTVHTHQHQQSPPLSTHDRPLNSPPPALNSITPPPGGLVTCCGPNTSTSSRSGSTCSIPARTAHPTAPPPEQHPSPPPPPGCSPLVVHAPAPAVGVAQHAASPAWELHVNSRHRGRGAEGTCQLAA